jgi:hypothetical protein
MYTSFIKKWIPRLFAILFLSLLVLRPSFNLHLSGDDYQSFWRYREYYTGMIQGNWDDKKIFLTDYGPQDIAMSLIKQQFGYNPQSYYIVSYILRFIASLSFIPLIYSISKNRNAALMSALFFSITLTGLESTDWVFNMPSYLAIAILNIFLLVLLKSREKNNLGLILLSGILFAFTIIIMPIRMLFLPGIVVLIELYWLVIKRDKKELITAVFRITMYALIMYVIFSIGNIGNSLVGYGGQETGSTLTKISAYFSGLTNQLSHGQYQMLLYPVGQIGTIIFPNTIVFPTRELIGNLRTFLLFVIPSLFIVYVSLSFLRQSFPEITKKLQRRTFIVSAIWALLSFYLFKIYITYPLQTSFFVPILVGGYIVATLGMLIWTYKKNSQFIFYLLLPITITMFSFAQYWLRDPQIIQPTFGRYLIIPAAGLTLLLGIIMSLAKDKTYIYLLVIALLATHMYASHKYLKHLAVVRDIRMTENIRRTIPNVFTEEKLDKPMVFYFEPKDSEISHHSLLFGFPVIMATQYQFMNIFNIAYTDDWKEVVAAYQTAEGLKRFGTKQEKVQIDNVYSYRLDGTKLLDTTEETRSKLEQLKID